MAIKLSFGIQKGGVGKTTTTGITAWLLSQKYKVLGVDFDSQGNLTQFLTQQNIYDFTKRTVLEAVKDEDPRPYIHEVTPNLHVLPAEDLLATFSRYIYQTRHPQPAFVLSNTLKVVDDDYDFILIDLPPNLGDQTINGLAASDYAVVMLQSEPFSYDALDRYLETLQHVQTSLNPELRLAGILTTMLDARTVLDNAILARAREDYEEVVFDTVIKRKSRIKEFVLTGIDNRTKDDRVALEQYQGFVEELIDRVKVNEDSRLA